MQQQNKELLKEKFLLFRKDVARLTQEAMAARLGITTAAVGSWEKRGSEPTGKVLWNLIKEFRMNPDWLYYDLGEPQLKETDVSTNHTSVSSTMNLTVDLGKLEIPMDRLEETLSELKRLTAEIEALKNHLVR